MSPQMSASLRQSSGIGRGVQVTHIMFKLLRFLAANALSLSFVSTSTSTTAQGQAGLAAREAALAAVAGVSSGSSSMRWHSAMDGGVVLRILRSCVGILVASAQANLRQFARHLVFTFADSSSSVGSGQIRTEVTLGLSSAGDLGPAASFVAVWSALLQNLESVQGLYPATVGLLEIMEMLVQEQHKWRVGMATATGADRSARAEFGMILNVSSV